MAPRGDWRALRNDQVDAHGFRRTNEQTPIGHYFADFVCVAGKIVIEAGGRALLRLQGHEIGNDGVGLAA